MHQIPDDGANGDQVHRIGLREKGEAGLAGESGDALGPAAFLTAVQGRRAGMSVNVDGGPGADGADDGTSPNSSSLLFSFSSIRE